MKKNTRSLYAAFLLTQLFLPVCTAAGYLMGRPFELLLPELTVTALGVLTVTITHLLRKQPPCGRLTLCLPLTVLNAVFLLYHGIMGGIGALLCVVCGWKLLFRTARKWYWWLCYGLCALGCAGLVLLLPLWGFVQVTRTDHVSGTYPSPEGGYTAIVTVSDQGALGGETRVTVRNEKRSIHILLGRFADSQVLWRGDFLYAQSMDVAWESEEILRINGVSYAVSGENVPFLAEVSQELQASILRGSVLRSWETHGGFHGDGETYVEISGICDLPDTPFWHTQPAPEEFWHLAANCRDDNGNCVIPEISEGSWYFRNRHTKSADPTAIENHGSWNYTLAVYDSKRQILYYYELDT